jgi:hypothetical protein
MTDPSAEIKDTQLTLNIEGEIGADEVATALERGGLKSEAFSVEVADD